MFNQLPDPWKVYIKAEFLETCLKNLEEFVKKEYNQHLVFPSKSKIFYALEMVPPEKVKVIILGQDPYHGVGQANGLCFSVPDKFKLPPSLKNIYKELENDLGIVNKNGNLEGWARQGVLLLNSVLTVKHGCPGSHANKGWEIFTDYVIKILNKSFVDLIFVLWGSYAQNKQSLIDNNRHLVIKAPHPSPFSAHKGFLGSKPFSKINNRLLQLGREPINWKIE